MILYLIYIYVLEACIAQPLLVTVKRPKHFVSIIPNYYYYYHLDYSFNLFFFSRWCNINRINQTSFYYTHLVLNYYYLDYLSRLSIILSTFSFLLADRNANRIKRVFIIYTGRNWIEDFLRRFWSNLFKYKGLIIFRWKADSVWIFY